TKPENYRPISLTSCLCKLMEKMVTCRLTCHLEKNNLLNENQTGFRKGRGTIEQIMKLQDRILKYNKNKGYTLGVFLDFEKAYDMLWRSGLLNKISLFADDSAIYTSGRDINTLGKIMQKSLDSIQNWCNKSGFKLSTNKSAEIIFTQKNNTKLKQPLKYNGKLLKMETDIKCLG